MINYFSSRVVSDKGLSGEIRVPGDKSISHRSVIFGSLAEGESTVSGLLEAEDVKCTMKAFQEMGVSIEAFQENGEKQYRIQGVGLKGLSEPKSDLDMGNSGTAMRLMAGVLSGQKFSSTLIGDASLSKRPMGRIIDPLAQMNGRVESLGDQSISAPPLKVHPTTEGIKGGRFELNVASAQVKSAILLAGLYSDDEIEVIEPDVTRDHTERMLKGLGCDIEYSSKYIKLNKVPEGEVRMLKSQHYDVPSDFSSAMFFIVAALITPNSHVILRNIGMNKSRNGGLAVLRALGADIHVFNESFIAGEPVADIDVKYCPLKGAAIDESLVALAIDEFPIISIAAATAQGKTVITGAEELRVKESDRISSMVNGLKAVGINASELEDGMIIEGGEIQGGEVETYHDHRISMSFAVAGLVSTKGILIKDCSNIATSFPGFLELANNVGFNISAK